MMLQYFLSMAYFKNLLYTVPAILLAISVHEFAHGFVSDRLGDPTPRRDGRLTLNPFAHLDIWGTICLVLFHMGWAKPVRINTSRYRNKKWGTIMVSLAGPFMNYILAFLAMIIYGILYVLEKGSRTWFYYLALINIGLGTFNLIPFPPLDGSNVLLEFFPKLGPVFYKIRKYAMPVLFIALSLGILRIPLSRANTAIIDMMWKIVKKILKIRYVPQGPSGYL
jgi:Zn-dependent protease